MPASTPASDLLNLKSTSFLNRKEAAARAGIVTAEKSSHKVTINSSVFGLASGAQTVVQTTDRVKENQDAMNEENWHL
jgi:hypothetical protein